MKTKIIYLLIATMILFLILQHLKIQQLLDNKGVEIEKAEASYDLARTFKMLGSMNNWEIRFIDGGER